MSKSIIVGSMNIQNKYKIPDYDGLDDKGNDNAEILKKFLESNHVDILGTQELVRKFIDRVKFFISPKYKVYGEYRYGNHKLLNKINILDRFNETVSIITKHRVITCRTKTMPWLPKNIKDIIHGLKIKSIRPRVVTIALIEIEGFGKINFINTHLTGDFNMNINNQDFKSFVKNLDSIGYKRVPNARKTYKYEKNKLPIDHIFIPSAWNIEEVEILMDHYLENFSDHYPMLVRISK